MHSLGNEALSVEYMAEYTGISTKTDLIKLLEKNINPSETQVSTAMSKPILPLDANANQEEAQEKMMEKKTRHFAVTPNEIIVGFVSIKDLDS